MKPNSIGIVGGAGPLAGAFLLKRILSLSGEVYGCFRDADFPQVFLISFFFSDLFDGIKKNLDVSSAPQEQPKMAFSNSRDVIHNLNGWY